MNRDVTTGFLNCAIDALKDGEPGHLRRRRALRFLALQLRTSATPAPLPGAPDEPAADRAAGTGEKPAAN